ncbi:pyrimidine-nucleoside phosphorylase [Caloranaerobacter azorensis DSM 13643]|uniref:Pyrimidine-nucleoside phosphorylase n=1 Tax=Caloranaerobacter azorensis DSM 13643 TaxID=1121264 RepID=A0A1M5TBU5_9FIRM|nr:pyrimidine-nucleoside phosphorylase [Caloranaerobacter azorensis]SHH48188.1 pyrimidine-nucleoside phosphorylase [Caloranaerobacter azorensis DSM 13643]
MRMYDIIKKKRDGFELTKEEIEFFVEGYTKGDIPDYQISALLMAIFLNKMTKRETVDLTKAMLDSGDKIDLSNIEGIKVDKHSTGGVGDKTTLVLGPMVAACGLPVAKMSGRGLGHTGGTLDKLESIKGLRIELSKEEFTRNVNNINIAVCGQTGDIAPADKKLYALRDVTATVDNISLIASSIMSKKLAVGSDGIVLDVKVGSGAFMKDFDNAYKLAEEMVDIGNSMGRKTVAVISNMDEPLGYAVGNALEVKEAIETLRNNGPEDLVELCLTLGSHMLVIGNKAKYLDEAREKLVDVLESGKAYEKFIEFVEAQGGDVNYVKNTSLLPQAEYVLEVKSDEDGYVQSMNAEEVGKCALFLGAGRETKESEIDLSAGIVLAKKVDDKVSKGEVLAYVHSNDKGKGEEIVRRLKDIIKIGDKNKDEKKLIFTIVKKNS